MPAFPEILCPDSKGFCPQHCRRWGRRKLLRACCPSAAPDRVISLAVPADAFPASSKIFSLPDCSSASLCPQDMLPHVRHLPHLVLATGILLSGYRSRVKITIIFLLVVLFLDWTTLGPTNFSFLVLFFWTSGLLPVQQVPVFPELQCRTRHDTPEDTLPKQKGYSSCLAVCALTSMSHSAVCPFLNSTTYLTDVHLVTCIALRFFTAVLLPKQIVQISAVLIIFLQT